MTAAAHPRLENLLGSLSLNLAGEAQAALERAAGLTGAAATGLLALQEFLGGSHIGRLADALGLTHSGAVRLVSQLEDEGLAIRRLGADRRRVQVRLTARGRRRAQAARAARVAVLRQSLSALNEEEAAILEELLEKLIALRIRGRLAARGAGSSTAWWCRTCDFGACGRPQGRCPAHTAASLSEPR